MEQMEYAARAAYESLNIGKNAPSWDALGEAERTPYIAAARAVMLALREPSIAMGAAGTRVAVNATGLPEGDPRILQPDELDRIGFADHLAGNPARWSMPTWRAMVDALLAPDSAVRTPDVNVIVPNVWKSLPAASD
jgi:hypothetical protein